jgi:putative membrane protein
MSFIADLFVGFVMLEHLGFLYLEMFLWRKPLGIKIFKTTPEFAAESAALAKNQGLYNGFLAAGLLWGLLNDNPFSAFDIKLFFLSCVAIAGIFGSLTVNRRIFYLQTVPALIAILLIFFAK